jgi:NAD-dependent SIR2 family protein deacetylase
MKKIKYLNKPSLHNYRYVSNNINIDNEIIELSNFIIKCSNLVCITGAGISTSSGIPDYRSLNGSYTRGHKPVLHQQFMQKLNARKRFYLRSILGWDYFSKAKPNNGHNAISWLENNGFIKFVVTQNVDRLHQKSGSYNVIDLHGRNDKLICYNCSETFDRQIYQDNLKLMNPHIVDNNNKLNFNESLLRADGDAAYEEEIDYNSFNLPNCPKCNYDIKKNELDCSHKSIIKPDVIFFGDNVPLSKVQQVHEIIDECDGILIIGTSLEVFSIYKFVNKAILNNVSIAAINSGQTRLDRLNIKIKFRSKTNCTDLLPKVVQYIENNHPDKKILD